MPAVILEGQRPDRITGISFQSIQPSRHRFFLDYSYMGAIRSKFAILTLAAASLGLSVSAYGETGYFQIGTDFDIGLNGGPTEPTFAVDTADWYGRNWRGLRIPLENARSYEESVHPFFTLSFRAGYKYFQVLLEAPLRKDLEAWYQDDWKTNFTYKPSELDINVPNNAYAKWTNGVGFVQFGRFSPDDLKISKNDILMGGAPYHDGVHWKFAPGIFRYDFMLSSLNPWLFGDVTDHTTGCPPEGTEAYDQKCTDPGRQVSNQRNRTYTDNVKNLVFHRFGVETNKFWAYVVEQSMVGGKALEFRSISPFIYWHDNYATGYTSAMTSLELGYKTANGAKFYGQINMEDINSPVGEDDDKGTNRSILNYMAGYFHQVKTNRFGEYSWRFEVVRTDPAANNSRLPLLKYTSRRNYRSNYREQGEANYADAYFVDYPVGYRRGADALDLWLELGWTYGDHSLAITAAWLRQGDKELYTDYDIAVDVEGATSGVEEAQYVLDVQYRLKFNEWLRFYLGGGGRKYENLANIPGKDGMDGWIRSGIQLQFNPVDTKF